MNRHLTLLALLAGLVISGLAWIDPLFLPLVLAGPPVSGALAAVRRVPFAPVAVAWGVAGLSMALQDWLINREDVVFHLGLSVVMVALAGLGWGAVALVRRGRSASDRTASA